MRNRALLLPSLNYCYTEYKAVTGANGLACLLFAVEKRKTMKTLITIAVMLSIAVSANGQLTGNTANEKEIAEVVERTTVATSKDSAAAAGFLKAKETFVLYPVMKLDISDTRLKIDPLRMKRFGSYGYLYEGVTIRGPWGVLTLEGQAMFSEQWDTVSLSLPRKIDGNTISGDNWSLTFNDNYYLLRNQRDRNFYLYRLR